MTTAPRYQISIALTESEYHLNNLAKEVSGKGIKRIYMDGIEANLKEVPKEAIDKAKGLVA